MISGDYATFQSLRLVGGFGITGVLLLDAGLVYL
jgi:hypothetical protein